MAHDTDRVVAELAAIGEALRSLDHDDHAARFELLVRRDALRAEAAALRDRWDEDRPTRELLAELRALDEAIAARRRAGRDPLGGGPAGTDAAAGAVNAEGARAILDAKAAVGQEVSSLVARRERVVAILDARGVAPEPAPGPLVRPEIADEPL